MLHLLPVAVLLRLQHGLVHAAHGDDGCSGDFFQELPERLGKNPEHMRCGGAPLRVTFWAYLSVTTLWRAWLDGLFPFGVGLGTGTGLFKSDR